MSGVVVGVNDSKTARRAARRAATMAEALGVPLHLVTAVKREQSQTVTSGTDTFVVDWIEQATQMLHSIKVDIGAPDATTAIGSGDPATAILDEADERDAQLIVVGNRRVQGAARVFGAVASDVLRRAHCDVLVADTHDADGEHEQGGHTVTSAKVFHGCTAEQRTEIDKLATALKVPAGRVLTEQGRIGREFGVLLDGTASVTIDGEQVATLFPGDHFGEMALFSTLGVGNTRTATVTADCDLEIAVMSVREFDSLVSRFPDVADRIRQTAEEHRVDAEA